MDGAGRARRDRVEHGITRFSLGNKTVRLTFTEKSTAGTFVDVDHSGGQSIGAVTLRVMVASNGLPQ